MSENLQSVVDVIEDLPPIPVVAVKVLEQLQAANTSAETLAATISSDQAVSARVLRIANSSFYGLRSRVNTLEHAIVILGEKTLKSLVLASSLIGINRHFGLTEKMLWEDSLGCAIGSRLAAQRFATADPEEAFLAGLFRHIGKMALNNIDPDRYVKVVEGVYNGDGSEDEMETFYFPYTHAEIGEAVLEKWNFSSGLSLSTRYHDDLEAVDERDVELLQLVATVNFAEAMCRQIGVGRRAPDETLEAWQSPGAQRLGVSREQAELLVEEFREHYEAEHNVFLN